MRSRMLALALLAGALPGTGLALDPSGTTVGVDPDAQAGGSTGVRILQIKGPIYMGDVITTDVKGQVQIEFVDDTKFVVGANSKVTIDAFVFDADKTAQDVSISAVKGAFRFITGKSPKDNYSIRTPTMTIGVRGTAFDLSVLAGDGESTIIVHEGATNLCDARNRCMETRSGQMAVGTRDGIALSRGVDRGRRISALFPLLRSQGKLVKTFQVPGLTPTTSSDPQPTRTSHDNGHPTGGPNPGGGGGGRPPDGRP